MTHRSHLTRRTVLAGAIALALVGAAGAVASGAEPASIDQIGGDAGATVAKPAVRQSIASGTIVFTTNTAAAGKVLFPMQTTPRCYVLSNFADARSGGRAHEGVDMLSTLGQQVYTPSAGTLTVQYVVGGPNSSLSGNAWGLEGDDGNYYFFAHLSRFVDGLSVGTKVARGQLIGYVGDTGNPGPGNYHLHFEIHPGGMKKSAVNPLTLLDVPKECTVA